jgi:hypothetical protein
LDAVVNRGPFPGNVLPSIVITVSAANTSIGADVTLEVNGREWSWCAVAAKVAFVSCPETLRRRVVGVILQSSVLQLRTNVMFPRAFPPYQTKKFVMNGSALVARMLSRMRNADAMRQFESPKDFSSVA